MDLILHGKKFKCLMVVTFEQEIKEHKMKTNHAYTLIDLTEDKVKLYDPHGNYLTIQTDKLVENLEYLSISYTGNKIFKIPNPKFFAEFSGHWKEVNNDATFAYDEYNLTVEEDDTEILLNFLKKNYHDIFRYVFIIPDDFHDEMHGSVFGNDDKLPKGEKLFKSSQRMVLRRGKYKLRVQQSLYDYKKHYEWFPSDVFRNYSEYRENDKNEYYFRLIASEQCRVEKS